MRAKRSDLKGLACFPILPILLLTSNFSLLASQTTSPPPAQDIGITQFADSTIAMSDTTLIRSHLKSALRKQKQEGESLSRMLRSGLLALRLGELRADPDYSQALSVFRAATKRAPQRPEPWYGLGLAEEGRSAWEMSVGLNLGNRVGLKALERAARHHRRALQAADGYAPAALALARLTLDLRDTSLMERSLPVLRRAAGRNQATPDVILAWGRVERAAGHPEVAVDAFTRYLANGGAHALGLLELARTQLALGQAEGKRAYYAGATLADAEVAEEYLADIALIRDSALGELDTLTGARLAEALRRFWTDRDRIELRADGERLGEHYRRLQYARLHFPLTISRRFYGQLDAYRSGSMELDDRGIIYLRHGEPATRLRPFVFGAMPNESWRYARAEGDLLLHFSGGWDGNGGGDLYDYRLVQSVLDLRGASDAPLDQLVLSRQALSPDYSRMLNWGRFGAANARARERSIGAASIEVGTTTDTYELQFSRRMGVVVDLVAVGRSSAGSLTHLVFGIAAATLRAEPEGTEFIYPVRVRLVALDQRDRPVASLDTTIAMRYQRALGPDEFAVGRVELPLPRGRWRYRASLQQGDSTGVVLPRDAVTVADIYSGRLSLSDLALGAPGRAIPWVTDAADTVLLAPSALFRRGSEIRLYYETSGVRRGFRYRHEITVLRPNRRDGRRGRPLVALSFEEEAPDSVMRSRRSVRLGKLKEGSYVVEVKVTAPDGEVQLRRRDIRLIER